jgi:hypothetical protein
MLTIQPRSPHIPLPQFNPRQPRRTLFKINLEASWPSRYGDSWEPPRGIEPRTYALGVRRTSAPQTSAMLTRSI